MKVELSDVDIKFLLGVLDTVRIGGNRSEVEKITAAMDEIAGKLKAASEVEKKVLPA